MNCELEMITVPVEYNIAYYRDFTDVYQEYLDRKSVLSYFCEGNLDRFDSEEDVILAYAQLISSLSECADLIPSISRIVIDSNDILCDERLIEALSKSLEEPILKWLDEVSFVDLAEKFLSEYDLKPLLRGRMKKGFFK